MKSIFELEFPIYKMGQFEKISTNALGLKKIVTFRGEYVLDDIDSKEPNYFRRRLNLIAEGYKLYHLNNKIDRVEQIIHFKTGTYFIDKSGYVFRYKKGNKFYKLECHAISKRAFDPSRGTILYLRNIPHPILYPNRIPTFIKYAGLLNIGGGHILYNLKEEPFKSTRRKI